MTRAPVEWMAARSPALHPTETPKVHANAATQGRPKQHHSTEDRPMLLWQG